MKKKLLTLVLFSLCTFLAYPQFTPHTMQGEFAFSGGGGINGSGYSEVNLKIAPGYAFTQHLALWLRADLTVGMFHEGKQYRTQVPLGLELGYRVLPDLELDLGGGSTVSNQDKWNFAYYDFGAKWFLFSHHPYFYIGLDFRYKQMYNDRYKDRLTLNATFGVSLCK